MLQLSFVSPSGSARLARTLGSTFRQSRTLAIAEFKIRIQMHQCAVLKLRKTPQNSGNAAPVALRFKSHRSASRPAATTRSSRFLNVSSWTHRRTSIVLLPHLGQRRWEMAQRCRTPEFFLSPSKRHGIVAASHLSRAFSVQPMLPNPSLKLTPNGMARRPVRAGASPHFSRPGRRAMPLGAA